MKWIIVVICFVLVYAVLGSTLERLGIECVKVYAFAYCILGVLYMGVLDRIEDK